LEKEIQKVAKKIRLSGAAARAFDQKIMGGEIAENTVIDNSTKMTTALNWYSQMYKRDDSLEFLRDHLGKADPNRLKILDISKANETMGFIARMKDRGIVLPNESEEWFQKQLNELPKAPLTLVETLDRLHMPSDFMTLTDLKEAYDNKDAVIAYMENRRVPDWVVSFVRTAFNRKDETRAVVKAEKAEARKAEAPVKEPKAPKVKTAAEVAASITLIPKDDIVGTTLPVEKIVGASVLVFYIPAWRGIKIFVANEGQTFTVNGKSLVNVDMSKSVGKKLRDPAKDAPMFRGVKNMKLLMNAFNSLATKQWTPGSARILDDHILVAAF
jgi:hypothetical protein